MTKETFTYVRAAVGLTLAFVMDADASRTLARQQPQVRQVTVNADGTFSPQVLTIRDGDTVEWLLSSRSSSVIPAVSAPRAGSCAAPRPYDPTDPNEFTGPMPFAPSGVFVMAPLERGLRVEAGGCSRGQPVTASGGRFLCATGEPFATMDSTWQSPSATGVFIRLLWKQVQRAPGTADANFDFSVLDREIEKAVRNGKLYSLGIKAGDDGTPDWIFSTEANSTPRPFGGGGVPRLSLQDSGEDDGNDLTCGQRMDLGSPTHATFQKHYFEMLTKVAERIKSRADWYRALAYVKPSGANLVSHENRLPKRCEASCPCNTQIFAQAGYTPSGLYGFYQKQFELLASLFPGKAMTYALIQDGFPKVNDMGGWERSDGTSSAGALPAGSEQTETILAIGQRDFRQLFVVQHNGLGPQPPVRCPNQDQHPAGPPYGPVGSGCPNRWVLQAGADGQTVTGFQINNTQKVANPAELDSSFRNMWANSDGSFLEIYEERFWEAENTSGGVLPGGKTLAGWAEDLHVRRRSFFPGMREAFPTVHRHTFRRTQSGNQTFVYYDPMSCAAGRPGTGAVVVQP